VQVNPLALQLSTSIKLVQSNYAADTDVTVETLHCVPLWKASGVTGRPRYDDVSFAMEVEDGEVEVKVGKLLLVFQSRHHYVDEHLPHAVPVPWSRLQNSLKRPRVQASESDIKVKTLLLQLCLVRTYDVVPRRAGLSRARKEEQPYVEVVFKGARAGAGLLVVPLASIQERVHVTPWTRLSKNRFRLNQFVP